MSDLKQSAPDERESFKAVRELLEYIDDMLTNAQPKIVSSCYPGRACFIDNYIDPVLERVRSTLSAWQRAQSAPAGAVGWQFYQDGKWWNGDDRIRDHRANTEAAGYPVRDVYAAPQPAAQGEAVYQIQYLGDGGGGWCDVEKSEHDTYSAQQDYRTRTLYAHATAGGE